MLNLLPWRRRIRLPREKNALVLSVFSAIEMPAVEPERPSRERSDDASVDVMEDAGDWREDVEVVVLLLDRPLKTESRLGL